VEKARLALVVGGGSDMVVRFDKNTLTLPIWALVRGMAGTAVMWCAGLIGGGDVAYVLGGSSDMAVRFDENTLAWPIWALANGHWPRSKYCHKTLEHNKIDP
jgi:hypothetical protein